MVEQAAAIPEQGELWLLYDAVGVEIFEQHRLDRRAPAEIVNVGLTWAFPHDKTAQLSRLPRTKHREGIPGMRLSSATND